MAQVKLLKISVDGIPLEMASTDDITLNSFTAGAGPVISPTGVAMSNTSITGLANVTFTDPTTDTINQTAGTLIINNIVAKDRDNAIATSGSVIFPTVTDVAGQVDSLKLPNIAGPPTSTPAFSATAGYTVYDSTNGDPYVWNGTTWINLNLVKSAQHVIFAAGNAGTGGVTANDVVYYSAGDTVLPAINTSAGASNIIGFVTATVVAAGAVNVQQNGLLSGFTGLTPAARYYLDATAGKVTATLPTTSGATIVLCGVARNATTLLVNMESLGRRA